ncbi:MAG: fasciclin domain-containing protein [Lutibacter sp.]|nr:fasciclin domain-containing protein [Lutibacter sp.]
MKKNNLILSILVVFALFIVSCSGGEKKEEKTEVAPQGKGQSAVVDTISAANVLQVAQSLDDFKTLVVAVQAAGVEDALVNTGPLTVFAPVNGAFDKLPEGTVATLLKPENKGQLAFILTNHVAPANYPIKQLKKEAKKGRKLYMASGKYLLIEDKEDGIYVGGTKILKTVQVSNGWIHVIDTILVPEE